MLYLVLIVRIVDQKGMEVNQQSIKMLYGLVANGWWRNMSKPSKPCRMAAAHVARGEEENTGLY